jgi:hypothetical protein
VLPLERTNVLARSTETAGNQQIQPRLVLEQLDETAAEHAIAADHQDFGGSGHERKRSACDGSGR